MEPVPPLSSDPPPTLSLAGRLLNVFAAPGDVFEEIKSAPPSVANWLVPVLLAAVIGTFSVVIMFSQTAILRHIHDQQVKVFEDRVNAGQMTRAQADQTEAMLEKFNAPALMMVSGSIGAVVTSVARVFWWAFVLWLLGLFFLKTDLNYLKTLEAAGLATLITVLGTIVTLLLTVILGRTATPSLALFVDNFNPKNILHLALAVMNPFAFWQVGVMATGLARLSGARFSRTLALTAGYWLAIQLFLIGLVVLSSAVFSAAKLPSTH